MRGSCSQNSSRSLAVMSARLPTETKDETPTPFAAARSIRARPSAPLWVTKPMSPVGGSLGAKVALRRCAGSVLRMPRQLGPTSLMPASRQMSSNSRSRRAPSGPASAKPADRTTRARAPATAHSRATARTAAAGTAITARSTAPAISSTLATAARPWTFFAAGFTGWMGPAKPEARRLRRTAPPTPVRPARGTDHRDRAGLEEGADRGDSGESIPILEACDRLVGERGRHFDQDDAGV